MERPGRTSAERSLPQMASLSVTIGSSREAANPPSTPIATSAPAAKKQVTGLKRALTPWLVELLNASIAINSTAFKDVDPESGATVFIGSKMETALLKFAKADRLGKTTRTYATPPTPFR
jgi:hypothetical protein